MSTTLSNVASPSRVAQRSRVKILDLFLDRVSLDDVRNRVRSLSEHERMRIVTANLQFLREAQANRQFAKTVNNADLVVTDGRPLVWLTRFLGEPVPEQITGHDLFHDFVAMAAQQGWSVFLLGGGPGIAREAAARLQMEYPSLRVMGTSGGTFSPDGVADNADELRAMINDFEPYFLFAALGCPKQDLWIARNFQSLSARVSIGVGGVFDVYTGRLSRAPRWMQRCGLESLFQLLVAPRRYARRYLIEYPPIAFRIVQEAYRRRGSLRRPTNT